MILLVVFLFSFTSYRNAERKIKSIKVEFVGDNNLFVKEEMVNKLLIEKNAELKTVNKLDLDLDKLENAVNSHKMVKKADVFVTVDGVLVARINQKKPVGRVFDDEGSFYIDNEGNTMPLSSNFTARVPLVLGKISWIQKEKLGRILEKMEEDDFLKKNITGIQILPNGNLIMTNRNYNFQIDFGKTINVERKFKNYKAFFQKAVLDSTLKKYKRINLKFTKQVVCIK
jgi:cell division protein FtsQ